MAQFDWAQKIAPEQEQTTPSIWLGDCSYSGAARSSSEVPLWSRLSSSIWKDILCCLYPRGMTPPSSWRGCVSSTGGGGVGSLLDLLPEHKKIPPKISGHKKIPANLSRHKKIPGRFWRHTKIPVPLLHSEHILNLCGQQFPNRHPVCGIQEIRKKL